MFGNKMRLKVKFKGQGNIHDSRKYQRELVEHRNKFCDVTNSDRGYAMLNRAFEMIYPDKTGGLNNNLYTAWMQSELIKLLIDSNLLESDLMTYSIDAECEIYGVAKPNKYGYYGTIGVYIC